MTGKEASFTFSGMMETVREKLAENGVSFECCGDESGRARVKVVCVAPDLSESVEEMGASARDQVIAVRVDSETADVLDAWVETGAVKSRSEAAALFIREGLKVRASELDRLKDAIRGVSEARERLRREAREVFGADE